MKSKNLPNSQKWTEEIVKGLLAAIKQDALQTDAEYLGITLSKMDLYPEVWSYWKRAFKEDDDIMEEMMRIKCIYESKLVRAGLRKQVSPWVAIFALKRNHGWSENPEPAEVDELPTSDMYIKLSATKFIHTDGRGNGGTYRLETEEEAWIEREEMEKRYRARMGLAYEPRPFPKKEISDEAETPENK